MSTKRKIEYTKRADGKYNRWEKVYHDEVHQLGECFPSHPDNRIVYRPKIWVVTNVLDMEIEIAKS